MIDQQPDLKINQKPTGMQCPVCQSTQTQPVIDLHNIPILCNVIWERREEAIATPRGDAYLVFCQNCGHVYNSAFDPALMQYDVQYENSLHFSPLFQSYARWLAHYLVNQYNLHGKAIVEIGSGKGDFLRMLCDLGGNVGTGFDPSYQATPQDAHPAISFVKDVFSERYADYPADIIISRHTLEHIFQPGDFARMLRRTIGDHKRTVVFIEVPNLGYILRDTAIWDIIYEHYSYFSASSLGNLFSRHGFNVLNMADAYDGQFLFMEAIPRDSSQVSPNIPSAQSIRVLQEQVNSFAERSKNKIARWREKLSQLHASGKRAVIWGAGSKGISFLNMLGSPEAIEYVVDLNPRKHNRYVTGAGQQIVPPEFLKEYGPDAIIIMNPIYQQEIQRIAGDMGLVTSFLLA
jgi:hypothetical protein